MARSFDPRCRVGNWQEDLAARDAAHEDLLARHAAGALEHQASERLLEDASAPVPLSETPDGLVRAGNIVLLRHVATKAAVSCLSSYYPTGDPDMPVTGVPDAPVMRRAAFTVEAVDTDMEEGRLIKYGDKVRLHCELPSGRGRAYLWSERVGLHTDPARFSGQQRTACVQLDKLETGKANLNWTFVSGDMEYRLEDEGQPVSANAPVLLKHCLTNRCLAVLQQHLWRSEHG
eukprot:UC1_evm1s781